MPHGIAVYNTSGNLIISETYQNYHLIATGTSTSGSAFPTFDYNNGELLYLRASVDGATITSSTTSQWGDTITVTSGVVEWVRVKRSPSPATASFGLRVYQSNGTSVAFDSAARAIKVVSSVTRTQNTAGSLAAFNQTINQPFTVPAGRKRYIGSNAAALKGLYINTFPFPPSPEFGSVLWTSDMQQTVSNLAANRDLRGTETYLFVDV